MVLCRNGMIQYIDLCIHCIYFYIPFLSLSSMFLRFIHIVAHVTSSLLLLLSRIPLYRHYDLGIPSLTGRLLGYLRFGAIMNKAAMNVHLQSFVRTYIFVSLG